MFDTYTLLLQCFRHFYHLDRSNAAIHMAEPKYSPITFQCAEALTVYGPGEEFLPPDVKEVLGHRGNYELDAGR